MAQAQPNFMQRAVEYVRGNQPQQGERGTRQNNTQQVQNTQQQPQGSQPNNRQQQQQQNNQNIDDTNNPENRQTPFDAYKGLWDNPDTSAENAPDFKLDDKLINSTADQLDFLRDLPEDMQEGLQAAFGENSAVVAKILNHIGRKAYATSLNHTTALTDKYLKVKGTFDSKGRGREIREHMALTGINSHEAAQKHPIVKETLNMFAQRIARANPDASPQWIQDKALEFFKEMSGALFPNLSKEQTQQEEQKAPGGSDFDWDTWSKQGPKPV